MLESLKRTTVKTIIFESVETLIHFLLAFLLTGSWEIGVGFVVAERAVCTIYYFIYERLWLKVKWGRKTK